MFKHLMLIIFITLVACKPNKSEMDTEPTSKDKSAEETTSESKDNKEVESSEDNEGDYVNNGKYEALDELLDEHVSSSGSVDYKGLKKEFKKLEVILSGLKSQDISKLNGKDEQLPFWINLYNAEVLHLLAKNYPVKSIQDLDNGKPFDVKRIEVGSKTYSLNDIENEKIRKFDDARIHFAVNCGAKSCPPLLNEAFANDKLEAQLQEQTKNFINNKKSTQIAQKSLKLSKIFDWYGKDFGNIPKFIEKFTDEKINDDAKISFLKYDWSLNE